MGEISAIKDNIYVLISNLGETNVFVLLERAIEKEGDSGVSKILYTKMMMSYFFKIFTLSLYQTQKIFQGLKWHPLWPT